MGPPVVQGAPAVPLMGVQARMSARPQMRGIWDSQPPPRYDSLELNFPSVPSHSGALLQQSISSEGTRSETKYPLCDLLGPSPRRGMTRMKRSNSEVTINDVGDEELDPAAVNPNTGATLRREYSSTLALYQQSSTFLMETLRVEQQPNARLPHLELPHFITSHSQSLQTATQDVVYVPEDHYVDASMFYCGEREQLNVQTNKAQKNKMWILGKLWSQRSERDHMQKQDMRSGRRLTSQKCFSHYDVQSVLFNITESSVHQADLRKNTSTCALVASQQQVAHNPDPKLGMPVGGCSDLDTFSDDEDGESNSLILSCPFFIKEIGGETERKLGLTQSNSSTCSTAADGYCCKLALSSHCSNTGVSVLEVCRENEDFPQNLMTKYDIEHIDLGAKYYLKYFYNRDHQNYFGVDENFGPVSLSICREKLDDRKNWTQYNHRIILRTSQLSTLRGSILEDSIPSSSKHGTARGLPLKDILEFVVPELNIQNLRLAISSPRVPELLLQLDQRELRFQHKVGVLFCRAGQTTEEQMYNNETSSPALDQFLDLLGHRIRLKGFTKYRGQLDTTGDSTGSHSVYTTFREFELMFHVSTLLPFTTNDTEQLLRKHHIGNNIVTVIFQESDAPPFNPRNIKSHFQNVFIIVRVHQPCSQHTCYRVAVSRCRDVPSFGPLIPAGQMFTASSTFRDFLLTKIINAEHAVRRSEKFVAMATHSRCEHLKELVENFVTSTPVDSSFSVRLSFISLGGKKKVRNVPQPNTHLLSGGALTWTVIVRGFSHIATVTCHLAISNQLVVLIEEATRQVVFNCYCRDVIGWIAGHGGIKLFYEHGECVIFSTRDGSWEDVREITQRLQVVTRGGAAMEMTLRRNQCGQLGFHVNFEGVVADVEVHSFAWQAGLRSGCRLMEICGVAVVTLSHEQMIELLRTLATVSVVVIPPNRDGTPRRTPPHSWHQVSVAPTPPRHLSSQSTGSEPEQQRTHIKQKSTFDLKEGSRMPQDFASSSWSWCSLSNQSTTSDPGPSVTYQSHIHSRGPPDWSMSSDEYKSRQERTRRTRSTEAKGLHHHHYHHVMKVQSQLSPTENSNKQHKSGRKSCSSGSSSNTLSSSSSDMRHLEQQCPEGLSTDCGIDSAPCLLSVPPCVAGATLVLRDIWGEGKERGMTRVTDTCSPSSLSDARGSRSSSECRPNVSPLGDSPEALITCAGGSGQGPGLNHRHRTRPSEREMPNKSAEESVLEEANKLGLLLTSDLQFSSRPITEGFVRMMQSVTAGEKFISNVLIPSPWRSLTRTMSDDSLYRRTVSLTSSCSSLLMSHQPPHISRGPWAPLQRCKLCYSDSLLADSSKMADGGLMPLPQVPCNLVDIAQAFKGIFSPLSVTKVDHLHQEVCEQTRLTQSAAVQDSDMMAASLSGKVFQLEEILCQLQLNLLKEQQDKAALQKQVLNLRQNNLRLHEESQSAADQIRWFNAWMLQKRKLP